MGVFSAAKWEAPVANRRVRSTRVRPTEGLVRDPWQAAPYSARAGGSPFAPVRGVSIEMYAGIARATASRDDADSHGIALAQSLGVTPADWRFASRIWNARITEQPAVAQHVSALYRNPVTLAS